MPQEPTVDVLLNRFLGEVQSSFYPFFVMSVIQRNSPLTKQEISDEIFRLTQGLIDEDRASYTRLVGRLEKTFGLVERVSKERDAALARYRLTNKGEKLYEATLARIIQPLGEALPVD